MLLLANTCVLPVRIPFAMNESNPGCLCAQRRTDPHWHSTSLRKPRTISSPSGSPWRPFGVVGRCRQGRSSWIGSTSRLPSKRRHFYAPMERSVCNCQREPCHPVTSVLHTRADPCRVPIDCGDRPWPTRRTVCARYRLYQTEQRWWVQKFEDPPAV